MARDPVATFDSVELKLKEYLSSYLVTSKHYSTLTVSAVSTYLSNSGYDYLLGEHSEFIKKCQDDLNNTDGLLFGNLRYLPSLQHGLQKSLFAMASNNNELTVANIDVKMTGGKKKRRSRKRTPKRSSKKRSSIFSNVVVIFTNFHESCSDFLRFSRKCRKTLQLLEISRF